jgi:hypothetical protein
MEKEKKPWDKIYCGMVAILAALYDPKTLRENPGNAIRSADRLIKRVPKYLATKAPLEQPLDEVSEGYWAKLDEEYLEDKKWGFRENDGTKVPKEKILSFDQAVPQPWCEYTVNGLVRFFKRVGYPKKYLERREITKVGYYQALENDKELRRRSNRNSKREDRQRKNSQASRKQKGAPPEGRRENMSTKY